MNRKLYVGNLPYTCTEEDLRSLFSEVGNVASARVVTDRETGRSKGFGFIEMSTADEAGAAAQRLNGKPFMGRPLTVNEARPQEPRENRAPRHHDGGSRHSRYNG